MSEKLSAEDVQQMFREDLILVAPQADTASDLITLMGKLVLDKGYVLPTFSQAVIEREKNYPTGLSTECLNFAVPHTDACHVIQQAVVVAKLAHPIPFAAMGMQDDMIPVDCVFLLLLKKDGAQVPLLQKLMNMCSDEQATTQLKQAQTAQEVLQIIQGYYRSVNVS